MTGMRGVFSKAAPSRWAWAALLVIVLPMAWLLAQTQPAGAQPQDSSAQSTSPAAQPATQSSTPAQQPALPAGPAAAPAPDSDNKDTPPSDIPRFKVGANEVNVVFTVTDKHGRRITDLK